MPILKTSDGAVFVQTAGPNTAPVFVGCVDVDTLTEPGGAIDTLIRCFKQDGTGWTTLDATVTPADPVTTTITTFVEGIQNAFELMRQGDATLFIHQRDGGLAGSFGNYARSWVLGGVRVGEKTGNDLVHHDTDTPSTMGFGISAFPPVYRVFQRSVGRRSTVETGDLMDIHFCGSGNAGVCQVGIMGAANVAAATPNVYYTTDGGATWTVTAADPLAISEKIAAVTCFPVGRNTTRLMVLLGTTRAGGPAVIYYSDDWGATWTNVSLGSTNALFGEGPNAIFNIDSYNIWVVTSAGHIFKSSDSGITWTEQDTGTTLGGNGHAIHFSSERVGVVGGASGKIATTQDGGATWTLVTVPAATIINTVWSIDSDHIWAGGANGNLYYSNDGGVTWNTRVFTGSGAGSVADIMFAPGSKLMGTIVHNAAGPLGRILTTIDGGFTWENWTAPTNSGLNGAFICDENNSWAVGAANSGTGVVLKVQPKA